MGSPRIKQIDLSLDETEDKKRKLKKAIAEKRSVRAKGTGKLADMGAETVDEAKKDAADDKEASKKEAKKPTQKKERSKKYKNFRGMVDRTKTYKLAEAVELLKKTSYSKFAGTVVADAVVKGEKLSAELTFPHSTGKTRKVEVVTDTILKKIEKGEIDFDVLIATPDQMKEVARLAKVLGPKGLMPNPKNGTITKDPSKKKKELMGGKLMVKTEKKAPLMHVVVGKTQMKNEELVANVEALLKAMNAKKVKRLVISSTMSPGIKVDLAEFQVA